MLQSLLEALIEDIAQDAAIGQYDRQCPTFAPTKITVTRMMFPNTASAFAEWTKHTCHKQNLLQRHRLVERGIELPCQFPLTGGKRCHCNFQNGWLSHKTTPPVLLTESHIRLLIAVLGITLLAMAITHQHRCHRMLSPVVRTTVARLHLHLKSISCLF